MVVGGGQVILLYRAELWQINLEKKQNILLESKQKQNEKKNGQISIKRNHVLIK